MIITAADRLHGVETYYFAKKLAEIEAMNQSGGDQVINLGVGSPDINPPDEVVQQLTTSVMATHAHRYQPYDGIRPLRTAISDWYMRVFDADILPDGEVLPLIGSKEGVLHISMAFLNPGDEVLIPNPGYPSYRTCTQLAGGTPIDMPLLEVNNWKPDLDELEKKDLSKVKMMWINYPNMPTGAKADLDLFDRLVLFAQKHKILVCHDNPYCLTLNPKPISIFNAKDAKNCCLELISFSKSYNMSGWRIGAVIGSSTYLKNIMTFKSNMDSGMFRPIQEAAIVALGLGSQWTKGLDAQYSKRKIIAAQIYDLLCMHYQLDTAGLFLWGKIKNGDPKDGETLSNELLHHTRVFITPGHVFGTQGEAYLRISLCSDEATLNLALKRISIYKSSINISV